MGTGGLEVVRFRKRYYIRYHQYDSYFEGLGAKIVASIPADPAEYQKWLESMRSRHAAIEHELEEKVFEIGSGPQPEDMEEYHGFVELPSELPRQMNDWCIEYFYIINLDSEVLTMNFSIHWKLDNIPREGDLWMEAISESIYPGKPTISLDICSEEHMASPALELPEPDPVIPFDSCLVSPNTTLNEAWSAFLTLSLAKIFKAYTHEIMHFGREWTADSFPFRELMFALVSVAANQARFYDPRGQRRQPESYSASRPSIPYVEDECMWVGDSAPLPFGSMSHRPGKPPGASPTETIYWVEGVVVSLDILLDGKAVTKAVDWAIQQGRVNFQVVILSVFKVVFAEVSLGDGNKPFVKVSDTLDLSPLRVEYCVSTHPRERPELKDGMQSQSHHGEQMLIHDSDCMVTAPNLEAHFPVLAALVNFFDVAATRRAATSSRGNLPSEIYARILDFVDYHTWKACLTVSTEFRFYCLHKYRLDPGLGLVAGPFVRSTGRTGRLAFDVELLHTGKVVPIMLEFPAWSYNENEKWDWNPIIGDERKVIMKNVSIGFGLAGDAQLLDSGDEAAT
ncbi:F-box domain-containingprotein [Purpureocillium lilacinum]|nr:F-box domain-containingprotein [Purpureocillium lilacinum]OAQ88128.1 F-box domain-containingprotein [Purpureocillium lilacinum]GJN75052.1 hypothetical protein PLICBS_009148 [Purpureocillium lilacinum]GJN85214.1 hypothetical protein PLIIFM63780_008778 [Purpureocillium lilacinum]